MIDSIKQIKGIVFDLDDTLYPQVSYKRSGFKIVAQWLASRQNLNQSSILSELEDILTLYGPSYPYMFDRLAERMAISVRFVPEMVHIFIKHEPRIHCYDGVIPMLSRLKNKYRLGILTDGLSTVQQKKIGALNLKKQVDEILCSDLIGLEKPATELFEWFENQFQLIGEDLMYVGDNPQKDFYGANHRGWTTVCAMTGENRNIDVQNAFKSRYRIPSIIDLYGFLVGLGSPQI